MNVTTAKHDKEKHEHKHNRSWKHQQGGARAVQPKAVRKSTHSAKRRLPCRFGTWA